jgi:hypothetical protein
MRGMDWPFDQSPDTAALTTRHVIEDGSPILCIVHYTDDHSWLFGCGTTSDTKDGRVISMREALRIDPSIAQIADLPPGWKAWRESATGEWHRSTI